jgi:hypothetical protein
MLDHARHSCVKVGDALHHCAGTISRNFESNVNTFGEGTKQLEASTAPPIGTRSTLRARIAP